MCGPRMNKNIQLCLVGCSCCIAILAVIMILVALGFKNKEIFAENSDWQAAADFTFMFTTIVSLVIIGTAVCGCMTAKHQGILKYIFGCFLLIVTILLFVISAVIGGATNVS